MQKDLKIGLALGLVLAASAVLWLATRPSLIPRARMSRIPNAAPAHESFGSPNDLSANEVNTADNQPPTINPQPELPDSTQYEQTEKIKPQRFHIVREGETLSRISNLYYGSAGKWQKILDSNRKTITDANKIKPGTKLIIPN
ncbi:MAG: LysM peptidoglycan-binding domain-containing protein [Sedimentisphaerales bacterium]